MRRGGRLGALAASLSLHGGAVLAALLAAGGETDVGVLFIDLTESGGAQTAAGAAGPRTGGTGGAAVTTDARGSGREGRRALSPIVAARSAPTHSAASSDTAGPTLAAESAPSRELAEESPTQRGESPPRVRDAAAPVEASKTEPTAESALGASGRAPASHASRPEPSRAPDGRLTGNRVLAGNGLLAGDELLPGRGVADSTPGARPDAGHGLAVASGAAPPGADYAPYLARLRERVQQSLRYPVAARRRGLSGTVQLELVIRPDGAISAVAVSDSSYHAVLDDAAVETIKRLGPEPFPPDVQPRTLRVRLPVVFALE